MYYLKSREYVNVQGGLLEMHVEEDAQPSIEKGVQVPQAKRLKFMIWRHKESSSEDAMSLRMWRAKKTLS